MTSRLGLLEWGDRLRREQVVMRRQSLDWSVRVVTGDEAARVAAIRVERPSNMRDQAVRAQKKRSERERKALWSSGKAL